MDDRGNCIYSNVFTFKNPWHIINNYAFIGLGENRRCIIVSIVNNSTTVSFHAPRRLIPIPKRPGQLATASKCYYYYLNAYRKYSTYIRCIICIYSVRAPVIRQYILYVFYSYHLSIRVRKNFRTFKYVAYMKTSNAFSLWIIVHAESRKWSNINGSIATLKQL